MKPDCLVADKDLAMAVTISREVIIYRCRHSSCIGVGGLNGRITVCNFGTGCYRPHHANFRSLICLLDPCLANNIMADEESVAPENHIMNHHLSEV